MVAGANAVPQRGPVTVEDRALDQLNAGFGNYDGALLSVTRSGIVTNRSTNPPATTAASADPDDVFGFSTASNPSAALFTTGTGTLLVGGTVVATVANANGTLSITFTSGNGVIPTTALVNDVLQRITYRNTNPAAPTGVVLAFSLRDGPTSNNVTTTITLPVLIN